MWAYLGLCRIELRCVGTVNSWQILECCSFSAVSTPSSASKFSFESPWRDLQDLHTFASLRIQKLRQACSHFAIIFSIFCLSFAIVVQSSPILIFFRITANCTENFGKRIKISIDYQISWDFGAFPNEYFSILRTQNCFRNDFRNVLLGLKS